MFFKLQSSTPKTPTGFLSLFVLIFSALAIVMLSGFIIWADAGLKSVQRQSNQASALAVAEAGIEYYRWHLAHDPDDFQDGTSGSGPYLHDFFDKNGLKIGQFSLVITPPPAGSTVVEIESTGTVEAAASISKTIRARLAIPSFSKYAVLINAAVRFGPGTEVFGPIHSNGGVRFDGLAHNLVTSALAQYDDPDHSGGNEFGVHTHVSPADPLPPNLVPLRPDIFLAGRQFPVPAADFAGVTTDLAEAKSLAQSDNSYYGPSGFKGYHLVLKTNDFFDLYRVTKVKTPPSSCTNVLGQSGWGTWTVEQQTLLGNFPFPSKGVLFFEDNLWIEGKINSARLTIASGRFPENPTTYTTITTNNDLLYTNYDGQDVVGLISQGNIGPGWTSEDDLRIDAAVIAQNGRVGRYYYQPPSGGRSRCSPYHIRQNITLYGMLASNQRYGFAYTDGTGYQIRNLNYDPVLLYGPPPYFPLTADYYQPIGWEEEK